MKIFARVIMVFALLCGLAYGSFAFGKYVLSNKLFGDTAANGALRTVSRSTNEASAVTRHTNWKGNKPRVEVRVLPADEAGPAPQTSAFADEDNLSTERRNNDDSTPLPASSSVKSQKRTIDDAPVDYSLGSDSDRPHRRRRKRRTHSSESEKAKTAASTKSTSSTSDDATASSDQSTSSDDDASSSTGDSSTIKVTTGKATSTSSSDSSTESRSESRSESRNEASTSTTTSAPRRARRTRSNRNRAGSETRRESPVPRPENSGPAGGDSASISPVPQPE